MMNFDTLRKAIAYVAEMNEADTAAIGDSDVWKFDNGEIVVIEAGEQVSDGDDAVLLGKVSEVLY